MMMILEHITLRQNSKVHQKVLQSSGKRGMINVAFTVINLAILLMVYTLFIKRDYRSAAYISLVIFVLSLWILLMVWANSRTLGYLALIVMIFFGYLSFVIFQIARAI